VAPDKSLGRTRGRLGAKLDGLRACREENVVKRIKTAMIGPVASVLLAGCASTPSGEAFTRLVEPRTEHALLYLYRPDDHYGMALKFAVVVDGKEKGDIGHAAYMIIPVDPGKHTIQIHGLGYKDEPQEIDTYKGAIEFLRVATAKGFGGFSATLTLEAEGRSKAVTDLAGLKREPERFLDEEL
jgi:hypothetical protein